MRCLIVPHHILMLDVCLLDRVVLSIIVPGQSSILIMQSHLAVGKELVSLLRTLA